MCAWESRESANWLDEWIFLLRNSCTHVKQEKKKTLNTFFSYSFYSLFWVILYAYVISSVCVRSYLLFHLSNLLFFFVKHLGFLVSEGVPPPKPLGTLKSWGVPYHLGPVTTRTICCPDSITRKTDFCVAGADCHRASWNAIGTTSVGSAPLRHI